MLLITKYRNPNGMNLSKSGDVWLKLPNCRKASSGVVLIDDGSRSSEIFQNLLVFLSSHVCFSLCIDFNLLSCCTVFQQ